MIDGYASVSTDGQSVAAQIKELRAAGAGKILCETASGAKSDRAQLLRALAVLDAAADELLVRRLDRLERSTPAPEARVLGAIGGVLGSWMAIGAIRKIARGDPLSGPAALARVLPTGVVGGRIESR